MLIPTRQMSPSPQYSRISRDLRLLGSKNRVSTPFAATPITFNPPQANDLQQHPSNHAKPKTQNSKIPERHTLLESTTQNQRPKTTCLHSLPQSPTPSSQLPLSLVFTHPSTYHRKVYARITPRTPAPPSVSLSTACRYLPGPQSLAPSPQLWPLPPSPRQRMK
jgi:hypothetical protein